MSGIDKNFVLGASFSPEYCERIGGKPLELLRIVSTELGINDIRLGLRWNVIDSKEKLSLEYYDRYLQYLFKNRCNITLNIGPIKVFRWPEEHIPKSLHSLKINTVTSNCELAKYSFEYLDRLLRLIKKEYGDRLNDIVFQLDNEPFYRFGELGITMSNGYILETVRILNGYFPNNRILFSSAGRKNLRRVIKIFDLINEEKILKYESLILGFNFYFNLPNRKKINPLKSFTPLYMNINRLKEIQKNRGFNLEISEGQFEPWGVANTPGNSYSDFLYLLDSCIEYFPKDYRYKLIRLWGVEELALKMQRKELTSQHIEIIKSIKYA